tara:strand:- start:169 stop:900 length:732 start_codon:yes stop_codon:yes gene_type:complete
MNKSNPSDYIHSEYSGYEELKGWTEDKILPKVPNPTNQDYFSRELQRAKVLPGANILEIGFGNGEFLRWAEYNGYIISGVETSEKLYHLGKKRGFQVFFGHLTEGLNGLGAEFDAVIAFDVLEHVPKEDLLDYFKAINRHLKVGGRVIVRFPNGDSPFGRHPQYGDFTHKTVLTGRLLEQVAMQAGFSMEGSYNTIRIHGKKRRVKTIFKYLLRDFLEWALTNLYFGERIPWDCSITCVLVKK